MKKLTKTNADKTDTAVIINAVTMSSDMETSLIVIGSDLFVPSYSCFRLDPCQGAQRYAQQPFEAALAASGGEAWQHQRGSGQVLARSEW